MNDKIDKGVPVPPSGSAAFQCRELLQRMSVADSVGGLTRKERSLMALVARRQGIKVISRREAGEEGETYRLWRIGMVRKRRG